MATSGAGRADASDMAFVCTPTAMLVRGANANASSAASAVVSAARVAAVAAASGTRYRAGASLFAARRLGAFDGFRQQRERTPLDAAAAGAGGGAPARSPRMAVSGPPMPGCAVTVPMPGANPDAKLKVELFLDYNCPFSKKMFREVSANAARRLDKGLVQFSVVNVPQPWHAQSCYMHEVALAARNVGGDQAFWHASRVLFDEQDALVDEHVYHQSRRELYEYMVDKCCESDGGGGGAALNKDAMMEWLRTGSGNSGNKVGAALKFACKYHRTRGVHVTPTVFINGVQDPSASSSWTADEWVERLEPLTRE